MGGGGRRSGPLSCLEDEVSLSSGGPWPCATWSASEARLVTRRANGSFTIRYEGPEGVRTLARYTGDRGQGQVVRVATTADIIVYTVVWTPQLASSWSMFAWSPHEEAAPTELATSVPSPDGRTRDTGWAPLSVVDDHLVWAQVLGGRSVATLLALDLNNLPSEEPRVVAEGVGATPVAGLGSTVITTQGKGASRRLVAFELRGTDWHEVNLDAAVHPDAARYLESSPEPRYLAVGPEATALVTDDLRYLRVFGRDKNIELDMGPAGNVGNPSVFGGNVLFGAFTQHGERQGPAALDVSSAVWAYLHDRGGSWSPGTERSLTLTRAGEGQGELVIREYAPGELDAGSKECP